MIVPMLVCSYAHAEKHARKAEVENGLAKAAKAPRQAGYDR